MSEFKEKDFTGSCWKKVSAKGNAYYSGQCTIGGKKFFVSLFDNRENKKHERSPDFSMIFKEPDWQQKNKNPITEIRSQLEQDLPF